MTAVGVVDMQIVQHAFDHLKRRRRITVCRTYTVMRRGPGKEHLGSKEPRIRQTPGLPRQIRKIEYDLGLCDLPRLDPVELA